MLRAVCATVVGFAVSVAVGCGGPVGPDTEPVSGVVTLDDQPVEGARVVFAPTTGGGTAASAITDAQGRFKLTTANPGDGAVPGQYAVGISKTEGENVVDVSTEGMSEQEAMEAAAKAYYSSEAYKDTGNPDAKTEVKELLPVKYKNPGESGLKADVAPGGQNEFTFELTSEGGA
jgi:hypothetical protein